MIESFVLRALVVAALFAAAALAVERVLTWYQKPRRWVWVAAMVLTIVVPTLPHWAPQLIPSVGVLRVQPPTPVRRGLDLTLPMALDPLEGANGPVTARANPGNGGRLQVQLWFAVSLCLLGVATATYARLRTIRMRADRGELAGTPVCVTDRVGPAVVGFVRPDIVVPRWVLGIPDAEQRLIVLHEREHIRSGDNWVLALSSLGIIAMPWCVPLWWQHRRLRLAVEADCDQRVLARGAERRAYGAALIRTAGDTHALSLLAPAWGERTSLLAQRIVALTSVPPRYRALRASALAALTVLFAAVACDVTAPVQSTTPREEAHLRDFTDRAFFNLPGPAHARILGATRDQMPVRVHVTGTGARLVVLSATNVGRASGDTVIDVTTPALLRVDGAPMYRMVAEALEPGSHVEIHGTAPAGAVGAQAGSATGLAPMLNWTNDRRMPSGTYGSSAKARPADDPPTPAPQQTELPRGVAALVHVSARFDEPVRVAVRGEGDIMVIEAAEVFRDGAQLPVSRSTPARIAGTIEFVTPAVLHVGPDRLFHLEFDKIDPNASISVRAVGGRGAAFREMTCSHSGVIHVWQVEKGAGICGPPRNAR